jgi:hypothetical protein
MDPKGKQMVINDKEKEKETLYVDEPKGDKPTDLGSNNKRKDGKKKRHIKKIMYYDNDVSSSSPRDDDDEDSSSKKKMVNQNYSFRSLKMVSHKMRSHLFSLHPSIWERVENGMHFNSSDNHVVTNEQIHKNAQVTTVLLASLCREEYNKVSGLDNTKQI